MTDCKHFPDQSNLFVPKNGRQQDFEPANSWCDTNPLSWEIWKFNEQTDTFTCKPPGQTRMIVDESYSHAGTVPGDILSSSLTK